MKLAAIDTVDLTKCETCHALVLTEDMRRHEYWHEDLTDWISARCD